MMVNVGDLVAVFRVQDEASEGIAHVEKSIGRLNNAMGMTTYQLTLFGRGLRQIGTVMTAAVTLPILGAAAASLKFGGDFESVTSKLVSLAGVTKEELAGVKQHILDLAPAVGIGPVALAEGMYAVSSTVADTKTAMEILDIAAKASAAGLGETNVVARALTAVINSYGIENMSAAHAADVLTRAIRDGGAEAKDLAPVLANVVPFAAQMGVSFEEVAANFATVTKLGVPASEAITQMTSVFAAMTRQTNRGVEALKSVNLTYADLHKELREKGLMSTLMHLKEVFEGNSRGLFGVLGRLEALKDLLATTGAQAETYREEVYRMGDATGDFGQSFDAAAETINFKIEQIKAALQVLAVEIFDELKPVFDDIVEYLRDDFVPALRTLIEWFDKLPDSMKGALGVATLFAIAFGPLIGLIGQIIMGLGNLGRAFGWATVGEGGKSIGKFFKNFSGFGAVALRFAGWVGIIIAALYGFKAWWDNVGVPLQDDVAALILKFQDLMQGRRIRSTEEIKAELRAQDLADAYQKQNKALEDQKHFVLDLMQPMKSHNDTWAQVPGLMMASHGATEEVAKAELTLLEQVEALSEAKRKEILQLRDEKYNISEIADETMVAADVVGLFIRRTEATEAAATKAANAVKAYNEAWDNLNSAGTTVEETLSGINEQIRETVIEFAKLPGVTQGDLVTAFSAFGLTDTQAKAALQFAKDLVKAQEDETKAIKEYQEALDEVASANEDYKVTIEGMNSAVVEAAQSALRAGVSQSRVALLYSLTDAQVKALNKDITEQNKITDEATRAKEQLADIQRELDSVTQNYHDTVAKINPELRKIIEHYLRLGFSVRDLAKYFGLSEAQVKAIKHEMDALTNTLKNMSQGFESLANITGGTFGEVAKWIGQLTTALAMAREAGRDMSDALAGETKDWAKFAAAVGQGIAALDAATSSASRAANVVGGALTGAQIGGSILPGWGHAIGAGIGALVGLFRQTAAEKAKIEEALQLFKDISAEKAKIIELYGSIGNAVKIAERFGITLNTTVRNRVGLQLLTKQMEDLAAAIEEAEQKAQDLGDTIEESLGESGRDRIQPFLDELAKAGLLTDDLTAKILGMLPPDPLDWKAMEEAAERYGIKVEELGKGYWQANLHDQFMQVVSDWELLKASGMNFDSLVEKMGPNVSKLVEQAIKYGVELPGEMRPIIEAFAEAGVLVDENGKKLEGLENLTFSKTMEEMVQDIIDVLKELVDVLRNDVAGGWNDAADAAENYGRTAYSSSKQYPDEPDVTEEGYAGGTKGWVNFGAGRRVTLHGIERVQTPAQARSDMQGTVIVVQSILDGEIVAENQIRYIPRMVDRYTH